MTAKRLRLDFVEDPVCTGWLVALNGRRLGDRFGTLGEVLAFAESLGTPARYGGLDPLRVEREGGVVLDPVESVVGRPLAGS